MRLLIKERVRLGHKLFLECANPESYIQSFIEYNLLMTEHIKPQAQC